MARKLLSQLSLDTILTDGYGTFCTVEELIHGITVQKEDATFFEWSIVEPKKLEFTQGDFDFPVEGIFADIWDNRLFLPDSWFEEACEAINTHDFRTKIANLFNEEFSKFPSLTGEFYNPVDEGPIIIDIFSEE